jgi:DNA-binding CsgD family transcriptional regulator
MLELGERSVTPTDSGAPEVADMAPEGVARTVLRRLSRLPAGAPELARAVAVLGEGAELATAAHVAELSPDRATELVDALAAAGLLERGTPLRFVHPLVRSAVAGALGPGELDSTHRRAAAVLAEQGDRGDRVAVHLVATRPAGEAWVVEALAAAAGRATARGAPDIAATYLRRAIAEPPAQTARHDVLLELGVAEVRGGDPRSIEHLEQAVEEAPESVERARAALLLGRALSAFGRFAEAVPVYERGMAELGDADAELALELEAELLGAAPLGLSTRTLSLERIENVAAELAPDTRAACKLLASLAREEVARLGSRERAIALAERSLSGGFPIADEPLLTFPYAPVVLMYAGELDRAVQVYDEALAQTRARGAVLSASLIAALRGLALHYLGQLAESAADIHEALDAAETYDAPLIGSYAAGFLAWTLVAQGELDEAEELLGTAGEIATLPDSFSSITALRIRGHLRLEQGRADEAAADLRECGRRAEAWQIRNPGINSWRGELALAEHVLGRTEKAQELATEQLDLTRRWGAPVVLAQSLRIAGAIAGGSSGEELLRESAEVASAGGARVEQARALLELGALLRRGGSRRQSREPLRQSLDLALSCDARLVAERAHEELVASGAQPRRLRESGPDALTPAERRVAGMAAEGMTNRAIAQALFVSEKTVESQMGSVFRKLDIGSRSQLAGTLAPTP